MINDILDGGILMLSVAAQAIVFLAMACDLAAGLWKASQRGEAHTSTALKRTVGKFITYEGAMLIATGIDLLVSMSRIEQWLGWQWCQGVPLCSLAVAAFLCVIEAKSLKEKAGRKLQNRMDETARQLEELIERQVSSELEKISQPRTMAESRQEETTAAEEEEEEAEAQPRPSTLTAKAAKLTRQEEEELACGDQDDFRIGGFEDRDLDEDEDRFFSRRQRGKGRK